MAKRKEGRTKYKPLRYLLTFCGEDAVRALNVCVSELDHCSLI